MAYSSGIPKGRPRVRPRVDRAGLACRQGHVGEWVAIQRRNESAGWVGKPQPAYVAGWLCGECQADRNATRWLERRKGLERVAKRVDLSDGATDKGLVAYQRRKEARLRARLRAEGVAAERVRLAALELL
jgi:hypothetical protein